MAGGHGNEIWGLVCDGGHTFPDDAPRALHQRFATIRLVEEVARA